MIRDSLVNKAENKRITSIHLKTDKLLENAPKSVLKTFFRTPKMSYMEVYSLIEEDDIITDTKIKREIKILQKRTTEISQMDTNNTEDSLKLYKELESLDIFIKLKKEELEEYLNK